MRRWRWCRKSKQREHKWNDNDPLFDVMCGHFNLICNETIELRRWGRWWGRGGSERSAACSCARGKGARLTRTGKGPVCAFRTPSEPEKLTCD